jgi:lipopolysaccharide export system permease protein
LPALKVGPEELLRWEGQDLTVMIPVNQRITNEVGRTNVVILTPTLWRTNLTGETAGGMKWRVGSLDPQRQELAELEVTIPSEASAWRLVIGQTGVWRDGRWMFAGVTEYLFRGATDGDPMPMVHEELGLEGMEETPDVIRSELRVASLRRGRAMKRAELTLAEIRDYRRLHLKVPPELEATLETQWHARLAGPWTCLVVVLIAIPFSVAPGRRNLFYGVAGSIGIAFAFFVLQKFGFALGQSGRVPGWLAAWLPNGVFALTGILLISRLP